MMAHTQTCVSLAREAQVSFDVSDAPAVHNLHDFRHLLSVCVGREVHCQHLPNTANTELIHDVTQLEHLLANTYAVAPHSRTTLISTPVLH